ncbi:ppGpp synthetase/RelA/SpoT-type nucleotidyltransferase [Solirubrobacter pauli]|uniref:PpGpp synthetase/RelA/SpoT-type nucleotidyltransferase n=1 Tax=Solirubrobacter pauli TaxID=166793 RepID=A0A660KZM6_9ACTN|nr:hypothetical protein [Solirubrobacter pauli]RKQ86618.1 ppGpp synthetase/RelA/SpoT-type nucleotidyltransferase [Solirubrobacter pauli]
MIARDDPADADITELHQLLEAYDDVLTATLTRVRDAIDVAPTSRVKNTGTILEKLERHGGSWLKSIHDLAGMRIVVDRDRNAQDALVSELIKLFGDEAREPKVIDRRESPSHGYRAVHVIVFPEDMAVEIQVRTRWQHEWADMFEKLADRVGRDIRYGQPPETEVARLLVGAADAVAGMIGAVEQIEAIDPANASLVGYRRDIAASLHRQRGLIERLV